MWNIDKIFLQTCIHNKKLRLEKDISDKENQEKMIEKINLWIAPHKLSEIIVLTVNAIVSWRKN